MRFPNEPRLYDIQRLLPLQPGGYPSSDFIEIYSVNTSRFHRWHAEAESLGAL